ncbi:replication-associated protein [Crucivirus-520]|nr:replication-associated protein [Crucivirus-520]
MGGSKTQRSERSRGFCFTVNNFSEENVVALESTDCFQYLVFGREVAPTTGTPHLQGYVYTKIRTTIRSVQKLFQAHQVHCAVLIAKGSASQNRDYCLKDGAGFESGMFPVGAGLRGGKRNRSEEVYSDALLSAQAGRFEDVPASMHWRHYTTMHRVRQDYLNSRPHPTNDELCNFWICGSPGTGKSVWARQMCPGYEIYYKPANKWWDGYAGEPVVLIEDVDPQRCEYLDYHLKIWSDRYPFRGDVKHHSAVLRPRTIIVTSNYTITQCFKDPKTVAALRRRFTVMHYGDESYCADEVDSHDRRTPGFRAEWESHAASTVVSRSRSVSPVSSVGPRGHAAVSQMDMVAWALKFPLLAAEFMTGDVVPDPALPCFRRGVGSYRLVDDMVVIEGGPVFEPARLPCRARQ